MSHPTSWKRLASWILVFAMIFSLAVPAFAAENDAGKSLSFEKVDNDTVSVKLPMKDGSSFESLSTPEYAPTDMVRVSIVLDAPSTLEKGFSAAQVASADSGAMRYRASLQSKQESMEKTISKKALGGEDLDVVWNLTLAANIISANVAYGDIEKIEAVSGVKEVLIETRYETCATASDAADPNMATSDAMIGSTAAWAAGYTGAGSKVAIIDTGADTDHPSLDAGAFEYAVKDSGAKLMTAEDIADKLSSLNAYKRYDGLTASDLYVNAKIPFDAMEAGDATAKAVVDNWIEYVACGISNVVNTFEPEAICIGGGVSNQGETLLAPIRKYVEEETKNITTGKMPAIRACVLTNDAGVIGAAALANSI